MLARLGATAAALVCTQQISASDGMGTRRQEMVKAYEERIRKFSSPEKNFSVYASTVSEAGALQMTPFDFVKSLMHFDDRHRERINENPPECFNLLDSDGNGSLSFTEYMLLLTLLGVPEHDAGTLFDVLDRDRSGFLEQEEFDLLVHAMKGGEDKLARQAGAPRAMSMSQAINSRQPLPAKLQLSNFSRKLPGGAQRVNKQAFVSLHQLVHSCVLQLEFESRGGSLQRGIDTHGFKQLVNSYANKELSPSACAGSSASVSFEDYCHFHEVVLDMDKIESTLRYFSAGGVGVGHGGGETSKQELQHAIYAVTGKRLAATLLDAIVELLDTDHDGELNTDEFFKVLKCRSERGERPTIAAGVKQFTSFFNCISNCITR